MANTYTQMNVQAVFAVKRRENLIQKNWCDELHRYIAGTLKETGNYPLAVGGYKDHVHVFFELNPAMAVSDILRNIKAKSSKWINSEGLIDGQFNWQSGYGAFTYSKSQRSNVINYILKQEEHHRGQTFKNEYLGLLDDYDIKYEDAYMFEFYE